MNLTPPPTCANDPSNRPTHDSGRRGRGSDPATPTSRSEALSEKSGRASDAFSDGARSAWVASSLVLAALRDRDRVLGGLVERSGLVVDTARPVALEPVLERVRFAD